MKADEVMSSVVAELIATIEAGAGEWVMPWTGVHARLPYNHTTTIGYRGGNIVALWMKQLARGYPTAAWATYKQWASIDCQVRKGERGVHLVKWSKIERVDTTGELRSIMIPNAFVVFNAAQVDGLPADPIEPPPLFEHFQFIEMVKTTGAKIVPGRPAYSPALDVVMMPLMNDFNTEDDWLSTMAHELAHWTGHESRLNRTFGKRFGDDAYAAEELVAELSSAFTCCDFGVVPGVRNDHASYLANWISMLKADPSILWSVASKAQAATDHLLSYRMELIPC
jgi:antirestriction protein ArdC